MHKIHLGAKDKLMAHMQKPVQKTVFLQLVVTTPACMQQMVELNESSA